MLRNSGWLQMAHSAKSGEALFQEANPKMPKSQTIQAFGDDS